MTRPSRPTVDKTGSYAYYKKDLNEQLRLLEYELDKLRNARDGIYKMMQSYISEIPLKGHLILDDVGAFTGTRYSNENLTSVIKEFESEDGMFNKYICIRYIRSVTKYNGKISKRRQKLVKLRKADVPRGLFIILVDAIFRAVGDHVLEGGTFTFRNRLGKVFPVRKKVKPKQTLDGDYSFKINLGETKKRKAKLLADGYTEDQLWSNERFNQIIDENMSKGMDLVDAKYAAKKDPRVGVPYAVWCDEEFNYWMIYSKPSCNRLPEVLDYRFTPSQQWQRRFQKYIKSLHNPEDVYPLKTYDILNETKKRKAKAFEYEIVPVDPLGFN